MQRMSENFIDAFGFTDAAFNDDGDDDNTEMNALTNVLSESEGSNTSETSKRSQGIFEAICEQRFTSFPGRLSLRFLLNSFILKNQGFLFLCNI